MAKKSFIAGILAVGLVFGMMFSGCGTLSNLILGEEEVQTEASEELYNAASGLVLASEDGLIPERFGPLFERQVPGVKITRDQPAPMPSDVHAVHFTYQGKKFILRFNIIGPNSLSEHQEKGYRLASVKSCVEIRKKAKADE